MPDTNQKPAQKAGITATIAPKPNATSPAAKKVEETRTENTQKDTAAAKPKNNPPKPQAKPAPITNPMSQPIAGTAKPRRRHMSIVYSFLLVVILPLCVAGLYLLIKAKDQYTSQTAFVVRTEDVSSAIDILGGLSALGSGSSSDTDILYEFIQSQGLVQDLDAELDLRGRYSEPYDDDPWFAFNPDGTIEDLTDYWGQMVKVFYDRGTGLIELRVHAFDPKVAQEIAQAVVTKSSKMINDLSAIARENSTRYARAELDRAVARLKTARQAMTEYRSRNQTVDPQAEITVQTGLMTALESQLSDALIEYDLLVINTGQNDPRVKQAETRIEVISRRIDQERAKYSSSRAGSEDFSKLIGEYEGILVDREFAEQAYLAALAAYDSALTEAERQSRYLAAYIDPTLAERAEHPQRLLLLGLLGIFLLFAWAIGVLIFYAIKDRR